MSGRGELPYYTVRGGPAAGLFNMPMGKLQRHLSEGEYNMFKYAPVFESDFIQVTRRGKVIDVHNRIQIVTVGIVCTSPLLPIPDVMLLARPVTRRGQTTQGRGRQAEKTMELTRLLLLKLIRLSVHDRQKQQLRLKFATGRSSYLQLCPPLDAQEDLFLQWEKIIYLLRPPVESNSGTHAVPAWDMICVPELEEEDQTSTSAESHGEEDDIRSPHVISDVSWASSAGFAGGEGRNYREPSRPAMTTLKPAQPAASWATAGAATKGSAAGAVVSVMTSTSAGSAQNTVTGPGAASRGPRGGNSHVAKAGVISVPVKNIKVAGAGAASKTSDWTSSLAALASLFPEGSTSMAIARTSTIKSIRETAAVPTAAESPISSSVSQGQNTAQEAGRRVSQANAAAREKREREQTRHQVDRQSPGWSFSSHRSTRKDHKQEGHQGSERPSLNQGMSRTPPAKDSRSSGKSRTGGSTASSGSTEKGPSRLTSFLRRLRARLTISSSAHRTDASLVVGSAEPHQGAHISALTSVTSGEYPQGETIPLDIQ
ncbi:Golgi-associated RAB2 interactor protein 4-like [Tamandua tetradactyla]|uniref:Golgi-associated RAB2 interactor protein 4-like n=1 Tax=Tamandua tetradactyla TaxID=48850 RepID=UPI004053B6CD